MEGLHARFETVTQGLGLARVRKPKTAVVERREARVPDRKGDPDTPRKRVRGGSHPPRGPRKPPRLSALCSPRKEGEPKKKKLRKARAHPAAATNIHACEQETVCV